MDTVVLKTFDNYFSANILLTRMRDSGIECYLKDEYTITIDPLLSNALGGIKLIVRKDHLQEAIEMLHSFEQPSAAEPCNRCGNLDFVAVPAKTTKNYIAGLMSWLFSSTSDNTDMEYKCTRCGEVQPTIPFI